MRLATPLADLGDFDVLLDRIGDARVVMLGEASHGTHDFYQWRAALTRRLIAERGFSFVAVEGDWPDCERVDHSVRCRTGAPEDPRVAVGAFERWPTWMWANEEVADFCRWLRGHNTSIDPQLRVGFHGLDVYSLWESLREILIYLREHQPEQVPVALAAYRCFEPYAENPQEHALVTRFVPGSCENEVVDLLVGLRRRAAARGVTARGAAARGVTDDRATGGGAADDQLAQFAAWQNAEVVAGAEQYYRAMLRGGRQSWNVRDRHMDDSLARLLEYYGHGSKAVVWAHNTHVGDARATDMAETGGTNIGQLARQRYGTGQVVLVGFGTHQGTVVAGGEWDAPGELMTVPPAISGSLEDVLHGAAPQRALFVFPREDHPDLLTDELAHRAIGVVYHPQREHLGNYVPTVLGERYDGFCWFDQTRGVLPMPARVAKALEPATFPTGV